ncbi:hypothetical protein [Haloferula sp. A504]|uniref:hypothetical protein n=1 Tax=Haloferula sp. A504 TaxID=3373601 RepID=UPI0031C4C760|nr:hypothetical protein [Verrucomicrobiaceae bacterium E54]
MKSKPASAGRSRLAISALALGLATTVSAAPVIDGTDDGTEGYVQLDSQTNSGFGTDNILANIKAVQEANNLHLLLGGLVKDNAMILFIDSKPGGINAIAGNTITSGGEEFSINNMGGLTFEAGFEADYAVRIFGNGDSTGAFFNTYDLVTGVRDYAGNSFGDPSPIATNVPIIADFGTVWTALPSPQTDAVNGPEIALNLGTLGVPVGVNDVKLLAFVTNGGSDFISDCVLGALPSGGNPGAPSGVNFETIGGIQTLTVSVNAAADDDSDGLPNSAENSSGTFNNVNDTGTNPNNTDTDGDFLGDLFEAFKNGTLGTNPNLADSDSDGVNDATEISLTGFANDPSTPAGGATDMIGFDFFDYANGGINGATGFETRVFDFDNNLTNDPFLGHTGAVAPWTTSFGTQIICGRLFTEGSNAIRQFNGPFTGGAALGVVENTIGADAKEVFVKIDLTRLSGATFSGVSFVNGTTEVAFAGVLDALNGGDRNFGVEVTGEAGAAFTGDIPVDRQPNTIVARLDTSGIPSIAIWVDPDTSTASAPAPDATADFVTAANAVATGIRIASGGRSYWDNLAVTTTWDELDAITPTDNDGGGADGLRDSWEELFSPGDLTVLSAGGNNDLDTLINSDEQVRGTNPLDRDTDGDTLDDNVETNTGVFVDSSNTGTDPCDRDTDDDTLEDGEEDGSSTFVAGVSAGSNPNAPDSDNDGENDGFEFFQGTDPNVAGDNSGAKGLVQVNGVRDGGDAYGTHVAVQSINTEFGDNTNELNAAYARVQGGNLYLMLTGNLEDNFNKLEIFFDSKSGGQSQYAAVADAGHESGFVDGTNSLNDMFFETGFTADYHLIVRRGLGKFDLDIIDLQGGNFSSYEDILSFGTTGYGSTGTGVNAFPIRVGYDNSNTGGVTGGNGPAVEADALAVTTGLELCIDLADLGSPTTEIRVMAMIINNNHDFLSNQVLGGLPAGTGNLGNPALVDFDAVANPSTGIPGDQSFTISVVEPTGEMKIDSVALIPGNKLQLQVSGLTPNSTYLLTESGNLSSFGTPGGAVTFNGSPATDGEFTPTTSTATLEVELPAGTRAFYRVEDAP